MHEELETIGDVTLRPHQRCLRDRIIEDDELFQYLHSIVRPVKKAKKEQWILVGDFKRHVNKNIEKLLGEIAY